MHGEIDNSIPKSWFSPYREILGIALPLIISTASMSLMHVVDRIFLSWYSTDSMSASLAAGITSFVPIAFFMGVAGYTNTFVAQYHGAGMGHRIGPSIWQGVFFSIGSWILMVGLYPLAPLIFRLYGHEKSLEILEVQYFQIMILGSGIPVICATVGSFFSGRGKTMVLMWCDVGAAIVNSSLNYCWIFGKLGFPEWGIRGAAWATISASALKMLVYFLILLLPSNQKKYKTRQVTFDREIFSRLMRFGLPSGVQFFVDVFAFSLFVAMIGRLGRVEMAATTAVFTVNTFGFMPLIGLSIATSTLVGRYLGKNDPDRAEKATNRSLHMAMAYLWLFAFLYILIPDRILMIFQTQAEKGEAADPVDMEEVLRLGRVLLRYVAFFCLFDGISIIYSGALKGAGDTRYVMYMLAVGSLGVMAIPSVVCVVLLRSGIHPPWLFTTAYVVLLAGAFYLRFRGGKWKTMRVIEEPPNPDATIEIGPAIETR